MGDLTMGMGISGGGMGMGVNVKISDDMMKQMEKAAKEQNTEKQQKPEKVKSNLSKKDDVNISSNRNKESTAYSSISFAGSTESSSESETKNTTVTKGNVKMHVTESSSHSETVTRSWGGSGVSSSYEDIPSHKNEINAAGNQSFDSDKVKALQNISGKQLSTEDQKLFVDVLFNKISFDSSIMDVLKSAASNGTFNNQGKEYLFEKLDSSRLFSSSKKEVLGMF